MLPLSLLSVSAFVYYSYIYWYWYQTEPPHVRARAHHSARVHEHRTHQRETDRDHTGQRALSTLRITNKQSSALLFRSPCFFLVRVGNTSSSIVYFCQCGPRLPRSERDGLAGVVDTRGGVISRRYPPLAPLSSANAAEKHACLKSSGAYSVRNEVVQAWRGVASLPQTIPTRCSASLGNLTQAKLLSPRLRD